MLCRRDSVRRNLRSATGARVYAGCSGWAYSSWKPDFYPARLSPKRLLEYYATQLNSVEVNYTFRTLPTRKTVDGWLEQTGPEFRFSFKAPQRITHLQRLKDCGPSLDDLADAIRPVEKAGRLGLILFQLPPNMRSDTERLSMFLREASGLRLRLAFEFRHSSWFNDATWRVLERYEAALCVAESDDLQTPDIETAPFFCYRLRRSEYTDAQLAGVARRFRELTSRGDVFAYFKHEEAPAGALRAAAVLAAVEEGAS